MNWRFLGEETFLSRPFSVALLIVHIGLLSSFGLGRWLRPAGLTTVPRAIQHLWSPPSDQATQRQIARRVTPDLVLTAILSAMLIGCLCARSLHYQFFVYIAWATPFLLWRAGVPAVLIYAIFLAQEWAWNVYPSTHASSWVVVSSLAVAVVAIWGGTQQDEAMR